MKLRVGNKENSFLNGEWAGHVRKWGKRFTAKIRRNMDKNIIRKELKEKD
jgi:hypothetical protein